MQKRILLLFIVSLFLFSCSQNPTEPERREVIILFDKMGFYYAGNLEQVYASDGHVIYFDAVFVKRDNNS